MAPGLGRRRLEPSGAPRTSGPDVRRVELDHPEYPGRLRELRRPPPFVFLAGPWIDAAPAVAVVGARGASADGLDVARWIAAGLARAGIAVLSGLARGIDSAAHEGALDAGGRSGAVLGTGIDLVYPPESAGLAERLRGSLGLLSELSPGHTGRPGTFASRNRLLAALADAIVVVQGRARSGALLTAREGLLLGRPVAAVPWDCRDPLAEAPHALIRSGRARLVRHAGDVIEILHLSRGLVPVSRGAVPGSAATWSGRPPEGDREDGADAGGEGLDPAETALWAALRRHPQLLDQAAVRAGLSAATASAALVTLELRGLVESGPGGFVRRARRGR